MNKPVICLALAMAATTGVAAEPPSPTLDRLVDCADLKAAGERLACFDRIIAPLARAKSAGLSVSVGGTVTPSRPTPSQPTTPAAPAAAPAAPSAATFGQEQLQSKLLPAAPKEEDALHARIADLRNAGSGRFVVTLDNGQAWRHEDATQGEYLQKGEAITISKGALGSYRLTRDAGAAKNWIRVTRIR